MVQARMGKYNFIAFTDNGAKLIRELTGMMAEGDLCKGGCDAVLCDDLGEWTKENFRTGNVLVFIGACGIAVRAIAPFVSDKRTDPAVIVIDEKGRFVIPILSGHLGGAVSESKKLADLLDATLVITTATDVNGVFSVDVFARDNDLLIRDMKKARDFSASLLRRGSMSYTISDMFVDVIAVENMPKEITYRQGMDCDLIISPEVYDGLALQLIPVNIVVGMGCKKGKTGEELIDFAKKCLEEIGILPEAVGIIASADIKKNEAGLKETADFFGAKFLTFDAEKLQSVEGEFASSDFVRQKIGVDNVCERAAMACGCCRMIMGKKKENGMTCAVGVLPVTIRG